MAFPASPRIEAIEKIQGEVGDFTLLHNAGVGAAGYGSSAPQCRRFVSAVQQGVSTAANQSATAGDRIEILEDGEYEVTINVRMTAVNSHHIMFNQNNIVGGTDFLPFPAGSSILYFGQPSTGLHTTVARTVTLSAGDFIAQCTFAASMTSGNQAPQFIQVKRVG